MSYTVEGDFLSSVQECDSAGTCVNPTAFTWQFPTPATENFEVATAVPGLDFANTWFASSGDVNGDGFDDLLTVKTGNDGLSHVFLRRATGDSSVFAAAQEVATTPLLNCSIAANCAAWNAYAGRTSPIVLLPPTQTSVLGDTNADGRADLLLADGRVALGQSNGNFAPPYPANVQTNNAPFASARDVNGDGRADLMFGRVEADNQTRYYIQYAQLNGIFDVPQRMETLNTRKCQSYQSHLAGVFGSSFLKRPLPESESFVSTRI